MMTSPLVVVRSWVVYPVPDVCSAFWTQDVWDRLGRRVCEPLVIDTLGSVWVATGERDTSGRLLYRSS